LGGGKALGGDAVYLNTVGAAGCPVGFNSAARKMFGELKLWLLASHLEIKHFNFFDFNYFLGCPLTSIRCCGSWKKLYNSVLGNGAWLKALFKMRT